MTLPKTDHNTSTADIAALIDQAGKASKLLRTLSHETRLMILCLLTEQEMSVSEIEDIVQLPQASVSQQLARLRLDDLVATRRDGRSIYYRIANKDVEKIVATLHELFCKPVRKT